MGKTCLLYIRKDILKESLQTKTQLKHEELKKAIYYLSVNRICKCEMRRAMLLCGQLQTQMF